jgi:aspartyl-tRNA(Asn)/glutamyl-tRNA(Gln) amidotransferase subunit C
MGLTREEVLHIAQLARVGLSDEDVAKFQEQLGGILAHFEALQALDTEGVEPTAYPLALESVMREDEVQAGLSQEAALANAPQVEGGMFKVRAVLEE